MYGREVFFRTYAIPSSLPLLVSKSLKKELK